MKLSGIDLFAGAGGLSLGAALAGVTVTHAVESNEAAAQTYRSNHPETVMLERPVQLVDAADICRKGVQILFAGPPCQGFSTSNQRTRTAGNPKNWLFREFFRFAGTLRPDWLVLENVRGLRDTAGGHFEKVIRQEFDALGYRSAVWVLAAADFGVPQNRTRLFFVGRRRGRLPPAPSNLTRKLVTVLDAISDLPELSPGATLDELPYNTAARTAYQRALRKGLKTCTGHLVSANNPLVLKRYRHIPPGGNWCDIPRALMSNYTNLADRRSRHSGIYRRLVWDEPSVVIANYRKNMLIHPEQHRGLSVREAARLQSFPDDYRFCGTIGLQQQQVSNAVPPLLAKAVFDRLLAAS